MSLVRELGAGGQREAETGLFLLLVFKGLPIALNGCGVDGSCIAWVTLATKDGPRITFDPCHNYVLVFLQQSAVSLSVDETMSV